MKKALYALAALLSVRMLGMAVIPLSDTTEARYAEMARKMLETGDWVTPLHDYGVPFLAKPPLWAWMSAASMGVFGVNEFAARLPVLLLAVLTVALVARLGFARRGAEGARDAAIALGAAMGFFVASGAVMTDVALAFSTTLILVSFWLAKDGGVWKWLFFVGCGVGLLAKGPVALVIAGMPVFFWTLARKDWAALWGRLPWVRGSLLTLLVAAPWYAMAEMRTPGFLEYFLVGENFMRFVDPGWGGDKYGYAHAFPYGTIWGFALACLLPWSFFIPSLAKNAKGVVRDEDGYMLFLALWGLSSLVFFTFAANIIWPYPLPALSGLALCFAELRARQGKGVPVWGAAFTAIAGAGAILFYFVQPGEIDKGEKIVVAAWEAQEPAKDSKLVFWQFREQFSPAFYSHGRAVMTDDEGAVRALLSNDTVDYIVSAPGSLAQLPEAARFEEAARIRAGRGERVLLKEKFSP